MASEASIFGPLARSGKRLDAASVHKIRKRTKQLRAQLELQRALEGQLLEMKELRRMVKKLAHLLAAQRDADVMSAAFSELSDQTTSSKAKQLLFSLGESLQSNALSDSDMQKTHKLLKKIESATPGLLHNTYSPKAVDQLLKSRLVALCDSGAELLDTHDWEALHDWRKLVKELMYQLQLKASMTPGEQDLLDLLDKLGDCLGTIHDMCVMETYVQKHQARGSEKHNAGAYEKVFALLTSRQEQELASFRQLFELLNKQL